MRPFAFSQQNTKFYSYTQTAIRFLQRNAKFRIVPKWPFVFFITKHKILKFVPKRPFIFQKELENFESCTQTANSYFLPGFYALVFYIFINNSRSKQNLKNPRHPFVDIGK